MLDIENLVDVQANICTAMMKIELMNNELFGKLLTKHKKAIKAFIQALETRQPKVGPPRHFS